MTTTNLGQLGKLHPRSSALLNVNDTVSMHLLMETAIGDSQDYEVLSFEEIDELKKEHAILSSRIDGVRRKLVLETKLRDAAQSLNRLYSTKGRDGTTDGAPKSPKKHRRSLLGSRGSGNDLLSKTDDEMVASARKCEELAQELWRLEKRAQELDKILLEHTAGILQITHKGLPTDQAPSTGQGSEQRKAHGQMGMQMTDGADTFDDRSNYRAYSLFDEYGMDQGTGQGAQSESAHLPDRPGPRNDDFVRQTQVIIDTEKRVEDLNRQLKGLMMQTSTQHIDTSEPPRSQDKDNSNAPDELRGQLDVLETNIRMIHEQQNATVRNAERSMFSAEEKLEDLNSYMHNIIAQNVQGQASDYPLPPQISGQSLHDQIKYLEDSLDTVGRHTQQLREAVKSSSLKISDHQAKAEQSDLILTGLWDIMIAEEHEANQHHQNSRSMDLIPREEFSLQAFSAKVQALYARATGLQEQKDILSRQIQQQRELHDKSNHSKDDQLETLAAELEHTRDLHESTQREAKGIQNELTFAVERLEGARQEATLRERQRGMDETQALTAEKEASREVEDRLLAEMQAKEEEFSHLEAELQELRDDASITIAEMKAKLEESEYRRQLLTTQMTEATASKAGMEAKILSLEQTLEAKSQQFAKTQNEMKPLENEVVRLHTELTVARAELDGAYGTRAQRAADMAGDPALQKELDDLSERNVALLEEIAVLRGKHASAGSGNSELATRVAALQRELTETIAEYEVMTKASIEFEKEREQLENLVDELRERVESVESELSDEKVQLIGVKVGAPGVRDSIAHGNTSTMVLKNEFKKMMRETRADHVKALRVSILVGCYGIDYYTDTSPGRARGTSQT